MNRNFLPTQLIRYVFQAKGRHRIHSAFVYEFYERVIREPYEYYDFAPIEHVRKKMLYSDKVIEVADFGTGSAGKKGRKVKNIARLSSVSSKKGQMLFRLINFMQPKVMIEMGTSLGISTLYQAKAYPGGRLITMEGSPETAAVAASNFELMKASNIKIIIGDFKATLPEVLKIINQVDYVFFDGNHRKDATLEYFNAFLSKASADAVFVFDDIRWSKDMLKAWKEIIKEPLAIVTIDLFSIGLVFLRKGQEKQHFVLKF